MSARKTKALICIPTYNEVENVEPLAAAIFDEVPAGTEILFIDDKSPDGTGALLDKMAAGDDRIHVMHRPGKLGLGTAYVQAFEWGLERDYGWFFEMDADFSHDPRHLPAFFEAMQGTGNNGHSRGADVVCGSRYIQGGGVANWEKHRLLLSRSASVYARMILRQPVYDWTGGFNAWSRETLGALKLRSIRSRGYLFQIEMKYRALVLDKKLVEVPIVFQDRRAGQSKMSGSIVREAMLGVWALRLRQEEGKLFQA